MTPAHLPDGLKPTSKIRRGGTIPGLFSNYITSPGVNKHSVGSVGGAIGASPGHDVDRNGLHARVCCRSGSGFGGYLVAGLKDVLAPS